MLRMLHYAKFIVEFVYQIKYKLAYLHANANSFSCYSLNSNTSQDNSNDDINEYLIQGNKHISPITANNINRITQTLIFFKTLQSIIMRTKFSTIVVYVFVARFYLRSKEIGDH